MITHLEPRLRASAYTVLLRHGTSEDEVQVEVNEPGKPVYCELRAHRIRIHFNDASAAFQVLGRRWSGEREDFPSDGAFLAAFEEELHKALSHGRR